MMASPQTPSLDHPPVQGGSDFDRVTDILAGLEGANQSYILHCVFSDRNQAESLSPDEVDELLRRVLGPAEEFASDWAGMSERDKEAHYGYSRVREIVVAYADSVVDVMRGSDRLGIAALAKAAQMKREPVNAA